ncbi:MAG: GerMN domain-containing protein [Lachnospiraceae bacterium]|nr:GerMN domain-containing protein [Lachnospiraceae bacterium]
MKHKLTRIGVLLLLTFLVMGCGKKGEKQEANYYIYYIDRNENHISPLPYEPVANPENKEEMVKEFLEQLALPTQEIEYQPVISGFEVKNCIFKKGQVTLNFDKEYESVKPTKEVLVRAAIVKTLTQIKDVEEVNIQVNGKHLLDALGDTVGGMSADTFIDNTGEDMKKYEEVTLALYFANETGDKLIKVNRTMRYNTNISLEKLVVEQLLYGPVDKKGKENTMMVFPTLNPETKIISVNIKDSICYVNFNSAFLTPISNITADTVIYSLVNSLTELPGVLKVQLAVDGETEVKLGEKTLSALFERNPEMVRVEETTKK